MPNGLGFRMRTPSKKGMTQYGPLNNQNTFYVSRSTQKRGLCSLSPDNSAYLTVDEQDNIVHQVRP